jgi:uncharacterized protein
MKSGSPYIILIVITSFILLVDFYTFRGIRLLAGDLQVWLKNLIYLIYWLVPILIIGLLVIVALNFQHLTKLKMFRLWSTIAGIFILFYLPKLVFIIFQIISDLSRLFGFILSHFSGAESKGGIDANTISRSEFIIKVGILVAAIPFLSILYGIARGRFNYKVNNLKLYFNNLPEAFNGYKVLQISDWHIGSFYGRKDRVKEAVSLINDQKADLILFTGDLVNNIAGEVYPFIPFLSQLTAPDGIYSVLGNHDYGEYVNWENQSIRQKNMLELYEYEALAGFKLLKNDSFVIEKNRQKIGVAGVENWGLPPFSQYGDLEKAIDRIKDIPFKILMSHDPSHWDAEVRSKSDIDLTLSGHTHGMQFGIDIPGIKWSPVKWKYPRWSGLYKEDNQYLYVNVGIGYIGFPGRVGIYPEITVIELNRKN